MVKLHAEPGVVKTWLKFVEESPSESGAFDGYVRGHSRYNGSRANFNHHEGEENWSTCRQVYSAMRNGSFNSCMGGGIKHAYFNHPDQDGSLTLYLLRNEEDVILNSNGRLRELVYVEDRLDVTAGIAPVRPEVRKEIAWIFRPYAETKDKNHMDSRRMRHVMNSTCGRIDHFLDGNGGEVELECDYDVIGGGEGWKMVVEKGIDARSRFYEDGITSFVSVKELGGGRYGYSLVNMDAREIYRRLNHAEGIAPGSLDAWGGSKNRGGSPRGKGSIMAPAQVEKIINT